MRSARRRRLLRSLCTRDFSDEKKTHGESGGGRWKEFGTGNAAGRKGSDRSREVGDCPFVSPFGSAIFFVQIARAYCVPVLSSCRVTSSRIDSLILHSQHCGERYVRPDRQDRPYTRIRNNRANVRDRSMVVSLSPRVPDDGSRSRIVKFLRLLCTSER